MPTEYNELYAPLLTRAFDFEKKKDRYVFKTAIQRMVFEIPIKEENFEREIERTLEKGHKLSLMFELLLHLHDPWGGLSVTSISYMGLDWAQELKYTTDKSTLYGKYGMTRHGVDEKHSHSDELKEQIEFAKRLRDEVWARLQAKQESQSAVLHHLNNHLWILSGDRNQYSWKGGKL